MRAILKISVLILSLVISSGFSQKKTRMEIKEEKKLNKQKQIEALVNEKKFVFIPRIALPSGMRAVNLSLNQHYLKFQPELIDSNMPFFGNGYYGVGFGTDTELHFKGKPKTFTIIKSEKNIQIEVFVKGESDSFKISLSIGFDGFASLSITSNKRSTISYKGEILSVENFGL